MKYSIIDFHFIKGQIVEEQLYVSHVYISDKLANSIVESLARKVSTYIILRLTLMIEAQFFKDIIEDHDARSVI